MSASFLLFFDFEATMGYHAPKVQLNARDRGGNVAENLLEDMFWDTWGASMVFQSASLLVRAW